MTRNCRSPSSSSPKRWAAGLQAVVIICVSPGVPLQLDWLLCRTPSVRSQWPDAGLHALLGWSAQHTFSVSAPGTVIQELRSCRVAELHVSE